MRLRVAVATSALAVTAPLTLAGVAAAPAAPAEKDCKDYRSQAEAQKAYDADTSDPHSLDSDKDKKACEKWPPGKGNPANADEGTDQGGSGTDEGADDGGTAPDGSVDAGGGGAARDPADVAPALAVALGLGLAAGGTALARRRHAAARTEADARS